MTRRQATTSRSEPFRETMRGVIAERLRVFLATEAALRTRGTEDPEVVHGVRVASRRLRAALDASGDTFSRSWFKPLRRAVKRVAGELGTVRDADVQLSLLAEQRGQAPVREHAGINRLIVRLRRERDAAIVRAMATLNDPEVRTSIETAARRFKADPPTGDES